jgi:hypothetical protein
MRTFKQSGFAGEAYTVFWRACERCGALGPYLIQRDKDGVSEIVCTGPTRCCRPREPRSIAGDQRVGEEGV